MSGVVVVVGSANLDVRLSVAALPRPGETVLASGTERAAGGKGLNQAVAAARSGARTALVARTGEDDAGSRLRGQLRESGVHDHAVRSVAAPTGTAYVLVDAQGENAIVVHAGANAELVDLDQDEQELVGRADVLLCQLEVPLGAVHRALASARGTRVLNAAPARALPEDVLSLVDVLVVNEGEARALAGGSGAAALLERVPAVVVTLGAAGAQLLTRGRPAVVVPSPPPREVVDTTGAGDALCGALAAELADGAGLPEATRTACAAASLSVERAGAAASSPTREQLLVRLAERQERG